MPDHGDGLSFVQADAVEDLALNERCLLWATAGPPMLPGVYNNNAQFVITRAYVAIVNEMIHDARIVAMDGRPHGAVRRWQGDSTGRWEQNTLVVDTVNFTDKSAFRGSTTSAPIWRVSFSPTFFQLLPASIDL